MATHAPATLPSASSTILPRAFELEHDDSIAQPPSEEYQRWVGQGPRPARVRTALALAIAATLLPLLGPWCWVFAEREVDAIERRKASRAGLRSIELARTWGMGATFFAVAGIAFVASFAACRL